MSFKIRGANFDKTEAYFKKLSKISMNDILNRYGEIGVQALKSATPVRTGKTANSWGYEIVNENNRVSMYWTNSNFNKNVNIAVIIQLGHGTRTGGYVEGINYIPEAIRPVFEQIAECAWKEVVKV